MVFAGNEFFLVSALISQFISVSVYNLNILRTCTKVNIAGGPCKSVGYRSAFRGCFFYGYIYKVIVFVVIHIDDIYRMASCAFFARTDCNYAFIRTFSGFKKPSAVIVRTVFLRFLEYIFIISDVSGSIKRFIFLFGFFFVTGSVVSRFINSFFFCHLFLCLNFNQSFYRFNYNRIGGFICASG